MESRATKTENHAKLTDTGHSSASKRALWKKLSLLFTLFMTILLINVAAALAQYQSHNVSEIRNIDADWNFYAAAGARDIQVPNGGICIDSGQTTCTGTAGQISADVLWKNGVGEVDGDITAVTTSGGITGGTSDGAASISLDTTGCVAYESLRRNSANTAWECVIPDYYTGDITDVIAGNGLTGGATIGSATINVGSGTGITVAADSISADCTAILGHACGTDNVNDADAVIGNEYPIAGNDIDVSTRTVSVEDDIDASAIRASSAAGLGLYDDASTGIFIEDGGEVGIWTSVPSSALDVAGAIEVQKLYDNGDINFFDMDASCTDNTHISYLDNDGAIFCSADSGDIASITESGTTPLTFSGCTVGTCSIGMNIDDSGVCAAGYACTGGHEHYQLIASDGSPTGAVYVDAAGDVGIGTTAALTDFHVSRNDASTPVHPNTMVLIEDSLAAAYLQIVAPATSNRGILFGEFGGQTNTGQIDYDNTNGMYFYVDRPADKIPLKLEADADVLLGSDTMFVDYSADKVGIGTTNPQSMLSVGGDGSISYRVYGEYDATDWGALGMFGMGVRGEGESTGGRFEATDSGGTNYGVHAIASGAYPGHQTGVRAEVTNGQDRTGIYSTVTNGAYTNIGVWGRMSGTTGTTAAVRGTLDAAPFADPAEESAVIGEYSDTRYGYLGSVSYGVRGQYDADSYGYLGYSNTGAYGQVNANDYGRIGYDTGTSAYGVYGYNSEATNSYNYGVYGRASGASSTNRGVYGYATDGTAYGVYASGGLYVSGGCTGCDIAEKMATRAVLEKIVCDYSGMPEEDRNDSQFFNDTKYEYCNVPEEDFEFESGDVVCIDDGDVELNLIKECSGEFDRGVMSVVNYDAAQIIGRPDYPYPVSLAGNVPVNVICTGGIQKGDPLVTSAEQGYAMKLDLDDPEVTWKHSVGTIFAKALTECDGSETHTQIRAWLNGG